MTTTTKAPPFDNAAPETPLYRRLLDTLRRRIEGGEYSVGSLMPTEAGLCAEFGVSRHTVREAMRLLGDDGLVRRRQGSGSLVLARSAARGYVHTMRSLAELSQYAFETRLHVLSRTVAAPSLEFQRLLGDERGRRKLIIDSVRRDRFNNEPLARSRMFIDASFANLADELIATQGPFYRVIEERSGRIVARVEQEITCGPMEAETARLLEARRSPVAVRVVRRYYDDRRALLQVSVNDHPAARFRYAMTLQRDDRAQAG